MSRIPKLVLPAVVGGTALVTAACGSGGGKPAGASGSAPSYSAPSGQAAPSGQSTGAVVAVASSPLGQLLVDGSGRTLYLFESDTNSASTCYDACAQAWPPLLTSGSPGAGPDVRPADLATTTRRDGSVQVTFHGHPLYSFVGDKAPVDTTGQGLSAFGALWYVVGTNGAKITTA
jgi:predicted lipoprotein with Yx(FWY)xxD motif